MFRPPVRVDRSSLPLTSISRSVSQPCHFITAYVDSSHFRASAQHVYMVFASEHQCLDSDVWRGGWRKVWALVWPEDSLLEALQLTFNPMNLLNNLLLYLTHSWFILCNFDSFCGRANVTLCTNLWLSFAVTLTTKRVYCFCGLMFNIWYKFYYSYSRRLKYISWVTYTMISTSLIENKSNVISPHVIRSMKQVRFHSLHNEVVKPQPPILVLYHWWIIYILLIIICLDKEKKINFHYYKVVEWMPMLITHRLFMFHWLQVKKIYIKKRRLIDILRTTKLWVPTTYANTNRWWIYHLIDYYLLEL